MTTEAIEDIYELSPAQQGMLFQSLYARRPDLFVEQLACELAGRLDPDALVAGWRDTIRRHQALRVSFHVGDLDKPLQIAHRDARPAWQRHDWRGAPAGEHDARFAAFLAEDRARGFVLEQAPLIRLALIQVADDRHWLVWTHHHLIMDGWSLPVVMREVFAHYVAHLRGDGPAALPAPRPFSDFIGFLQGEDLDALAGRWRDYLAGLDTTLMVSPEHRAATAAAETAGAYGEHAGQLSPESSAALTRLARERGVTVGAIAQAIWALVLARLTGRSDVVFGVTVSGRPAGLAGAETIVGPFINTLPVRMQVPAAGDLFDWLAGAEHARAPWRISEHVSAARILEWTGLPATRPLFDTIVVVGNYPTDGVLAPAPGLHVGHVRVSGGRTGVPLVLMIDPGPQLAVKLISDRQLFDDASAQAVWKTVRAALEAVAAQPALPLAELAAPADALRPRIAALRVAATPPARTTYMAPRNPIESEIAQIWAELLEVDRIGIDDDYFELGGHSLVAARILVRLREVFRVQLPVHLLFTRRLTVAGLAETVAEHLIAQAQGDELAEAMAELDGLSDDEVRALLAEGGGAAAESARR